MSPLGAFDYTGTTNQNGIHFDSRASVRPRLTYRAHCEKCKTSFTVPHTKAEYAECPNRRNHGKAAQKVSPSLGSTGSREESVRSSNSADSREFQQQEAENGVGTVHIQGRRNVRLSVHRDLNSGYFLSQGLTSDRARAEYRQHVAEEAAAEEAKIAPVRAEWERLSQALALEQRNAIRDGADLWFIDGLSNDEKLDILTVAEMSDEQQELAQQIANDLFLESMVRQDFVPTKGNSQIIFGYLERQFKAAGLPSCYAPCSCLIRAFARCRWANLLQEVEHIYHPMPEPTENYMEAEARRQREEAARQAEIASRTGIDPATGLPRIYTAREIYLMSGDDLRRAQIGGKVRSTFTDVFSANEARR